MKLQPVNGSVLHILSRPYLRIMNFNLTKAWSADYWALEISQHSIVEVRTFSSSQATVQSSHTLYSIAFSFRISFVIFLLCVISSSLVPTIISDVLSSVSNAFDIVNMHPLHVYINYSKKRYNNKCSSSRMFWLKLDSFH